MRFPPIAIVGRGCVLPGALSPAALWAAVVEGRDLLTSAPPGAWRLAPELSVAPGAPAPIDRGGYIRGFDEIFDPEGFEIPADEVLGFDRSTAWLLHAGREALREAGGTAPAVASRVGAIVGNLSLPSVGLSRFAESVWLADMPGLRDARDRLDDHAADPRHRFMSARPARLLARSLGLGGEAFALDAACASSLYALRLACDALHDGRADLMLAGALNGTDPLFLHTGFRVLQALSPTGRSRPFHRAADGLVPSEGAVILALKRLPDAVAAGDRIHGVIRGVGLSNDGGAAGLLVPAPSGQERAMRAAFAAAGFGPGRISLVECHATGTAVGDASEIRGMEAVYTDVPEVPIGSLKSNLGHSLTVSGAAGLLKVLSAMEAGVRPPTLHVDEALSEITGSRFRIVRETEPWETDEPRCAAVSSFGFGGNNAHLLVEQWDPATARGRVVATGNKCESEAKEIAIVALGVVAAGASNRGEFADALLAGRPMLTEGPHGPAGVAAAARLAIDGLRFPPRDLAEALPQQVLLLHAAREALASVATPPNDRVGVFAGMECDPEICRHMARLRVAEWAPEWANAEAFLLPESWMGAARGAFAAPLTPPAVLGTLPNIVANRIGAQFRFGGPSFAVSAEEHSGIVALALASRALRAGELECAVVGAVDLCCEPVHRTASASVLPPDRQIPGDAAVVLVLKRLADAVRDGDEVLAILADDSGDLRKGVDGEGRRPDPDDASSAAADTANDAALNFGDADGALDLTPLFGHAHAASGLLHVAAAAVCCSTRALPGAARPSPWLTDRGARHARVDFRGSAPNAARVSLRAPTPADGLPPTRSRDHASGSFDRPFLEVFAGEDRAAVLAAVEADRPGGSGPARLVISGLSTAERSERIIRAVEFLRSESTEAPPGVAFAERPVEGDLAFVFAGAGAAYRGMGRDLALTFPAQLDRVGDLMPRLRAAAGWAYEPADAEPTPLEKLTGSSVLCQLQARITVDVLGLAPRVALGLSSGETNSLAALGAWNDLGDLLEGLEEIYERELGGEFRALEALWGGEGHAWETWRLLLPAEAVLEAIGDEPRVFLTMRNSPDDCAIGGESAACARVLDRLGRDRAYPLGYDLAVHCPAIGIVEDRWKELHRHPTTDVPGVRFHSAVTEGPYTPTSDGVAATLTRMASEPVDFPALIERAWADGARVFVEHGPRDLCGRWIRQILADREHLVVSLDRPGADGRVQLLNAAAELVAAGIDVDVETLLSHLEAPRASAPASARNSMEVPAHPRPVAIPTIPVTGFQHMPPAPELPGSWEEDEPWTGDATWERDNAAASDEIREINEEPIMPLTNGADPAASPEPGTFGIVSTVHREFLERQASVHQHFLQTRSALMARLAGRAGIAGGAEDASAAEVPFAVGRPDTDVATAGRGTALRSTAPAGPIHPAMSVSPAISTGPATSSNPAVSPAPVARPRPEHAPIPTPPASRIEPASAAAPAGPPLFDRKDLEKLASGRISDLFGPEFSVQDDFPRQVRMPMPPLLLADRVVRIDAPRGTMGTGSIVTETDVTEDAWYLHDGFMPAGIQIEAGQADLLLCSWLGADLHNRGDRVYRLLGCELTYHGSRPRVGDTLRYDIHIDRHARTGDVRLFFFHYNCTVDGEPRLTVRGGHAGFFSDAELAGSGGVLWSAEAEKPEPPLNAVTPRLPGDRRALTADQVRAFSEGRTWECFGSGFEKTAAQIRPPRIQSGEMLLVDEVTDLDPTGGPWGLGYLRAVRAIRPDDWFFPGHFKNDPTMPGTLMFEGGLQTMAIYLAALGYTIEQDGARFEPVPDVPYSMVCRGQVVPTAREIVYELFVHGIEERENPVLWADILLTVDGLKAFHCKRMGMRIVPDWPLTPVAAASVPEEVRPVASVDGFRFGYESLLHCAWGLPSLAFGPRYAAFDGPRRLPRLPGPPYHFISRVTALEGEMGVVATGAAVEVEYDVPPDAWYFTDNPGGTMPFSVLMEAALQPCGWLTAYMGIPLSLSTDLRFRNLNGDGRVLAEVFPDSGVLRTTVRCLNVSRSGETFIETFDVNCYLGDVHVFALNTAFGHFPAEALEQQVGVPFTEAERTALEDSAETGRVELKTADPERNGTVREGDMPVHAELRRWVTPAGTPGPAGVTSSNAVDQLSRPTPSTGAENDAESGAVTPTLGIGRGLLSLLDRVTGDWPDGGRAGKGRLRAEMDVDPAAWFFSAHFFQDPVQPGSLGVEAMIQALQQYMLSRGLGEGFRRPRFQSIEVDAPVTWKYRGQVIPTNRRVLIELEITEEGRDGAGAFARAEAWLWCDGKRIYHAPRIGMRIVEDERPAPASDVTAAASISAAPAAPGPVDTSFDELLDPDVDLWLRDHCPTYTLPALPMMFMVDRIAAAAAHLGSGQVVAGLRDVQVNRWLICDHPRRIRTTVRPAPGNDGEIEGVLLAWRDASVPALSRYEPVAAGNVMLATEFSEPPAPFPPLEDAVVAADPYETGALIHGPGFHLLRELRIGASGSSAILDAGAGSIPPGALNQLLLDGITHAIPNAELHRWSEEVGEDVIAYPLRITEASFHGPTPLAGEIRCEVRFAGFDRDERRTPRFRIQLQREGTVWTEMTFVASLNPKGPIGRLDGRDRRAFIRDRLPVPDAGLSRTLDGETRLDPADVVMSDWLPGTINRLYGTDARGEELAREIAIREHIARKAGFHPSTVHLSDDGTAAHCDALPFSRFSVTVSGDEREGPLVVRDAAPERMDFAAATAYWRERLGVGGWPVEDMYFAMAEKFVRRVVLADPEAFAGIRGRSALFVANHQVAVESFLFALLNPGLTGVPSVVLAKSEVRTRWLDEYLTLAEGYPGVALPSFIIYMNQKNPLEVLETFRRCREQMARGGLSALVHIEGTRSLSCAEPVRVISSSLIDMAIDADAPIVPVRFVGGLPREPLEKRLHVPVGYGSQDYFFGRPILPEELRAVPYADRRRVVLDAINALGVSADDERPNPPDPEFQHDTREWMDSTGTDEEYSILLRALQRLREPGDEMRVILDAARDGVLRVRRDKLGAWTAELGRRLFSERGPRIERRK